MSTPPFPPPVVSRGARNQQLEFKAPTQDFNANPQTPAPGFAAFPITPILGQVPAAPPERKKKTKNIAEEHEEMGGFGDDSKEKLNIRSSKCLFATW